MTAALVALVCALPMRGSMKVTVEIAVTSGDSGRTLEVYYEVPHNSLIFLRSGDEYLARFQFRVQVANRANQALGGRFWDISARSADFAMTNDRESLAVGTLTMPMPESASIVSVEVRDRSSERKASGRLDLGALGSGLALNFTGGAGIRGVRRVGIEDTLSVVALAEPGTAMDSCRFLLKSGGRAIWGRTATARDSGGRRAADFAYPVAGIEGGPRLRIGDYELLATALSAQGQSSAAATFRVEYPFYFDDSAYKSRVEQLAYIATATEIKRLRDARPVERESIWADFWRPRDDVPATDRNEREEEYFARISYAEEKFRHGDRGFRSDRGRVYVVYGPPDQVESRPFELDSPAYEVWSYYGSGRSFTFVDRYGTGQFVLVSTGG